MNKDLIIIALIILVIYLYYQQNNLDNHQPLEQLQQEIKHYQSLYQQQAEKDFGGSEKVKELESNWQQEKESLINEHSQAIEQWQNDYNLVQEQNHSLKTEVTNIKSLLVKGQDFTIQLQSQLQEKINHLQEQVSNNSKEHQEQLRKINILFDANATNYQTIDFNGLYELLKQVAERGRGGAT